MSELRIDSWRLPAAELGAENPLPNFDRPRYQPVLSGKPEADSEAGYLRDYLPYSVQDGYTRQRQPRDLKVAVLENEVLRATFLLDYGGRLWSLRHKPSGRELLYVNPIFQPANLALRNAWFSGGVEWNMGVIGHTPFTCSPLFAARIHTLDGTPILRLYEWERIRRVTYQIDAYLPDKSPVLYVRVKLVNPFDHALPMYWWSNIAVNEHEDVRVLVPAEQAYQYALSVENLKTVAIPLVDGKDISYTTHEQRAADYFFLIPSGQRPWISAVDGEGKGLIQTSTGALCGRKLFLWGMGQGGTRWQEWLSGSKQRYLEIQAGLAPTQLEYAVLPAQSETSWLEGYGLLEADPKIVHGQDWAAACAEVSERLEQLAPHAAFEAEYQHGRLWEQQPPTEILHRGSGWGALEALRREKMGESPFAGAALDFGGSLGAPQQPWVELLETGRFPNSDSDVPRAGVLVQPEWHTLLEKAVEQSGSWEVWLHLGEMRLHVGDLDGAQQAWQISLAHKPTAWAWRNLGVIARHRGQLDQAADCYREAQKLRPDLIALLVEAARVLIDAGTPAEFLDLLSTLPQSMRDQGRVRLLEVEAALVLHDLDRVGRLFTNGFEIVDYQEGDEILTELWFDYHAQRISQAEGLVIDEVLHERIRREYPLPAQFDFRMTVG